MNMNKNELIELLNSNKWTHKYKVYNNIIDSRFRNLDSKVFEAVTSHWYDFYVTIESRLGDKYIESTICGYYEFFSYLRKASFKICSGSIDLYHNLKNEESRFFDNWLLIDLLPSKFKYLDFGIIENEIVKSFKLPYSEKLKYLECFDSERNDFIEENARQCELFLKRFVYHAMSFDIDIRFYFKSQDKAQKESSLDLFVEKVIEFYNDNKDIFDFDDKLTLAFIKNQLIKIYLYHYRSNYIVPHNYRNIYYLINGIFLSLINN